MIYYSNNLLFTFVPVLRKKKINFIARKIKKKNQKKSKTVNENNKYNDTPFIFTRRHTAEKIFAIIMLDAMSFIVYVCIHTVKRNKRSHFTIGIELVPLVPLSLFL